jgi:hypothetical protein
MGFINPPYGRPHRCEFDVGHTGWHGERSGWRWEDPEVPTIREPIGFLVALRENGAWTDTWDGEIHETIEEAKASADEAAKTEDEGCGWEVVVCQLMPVEEVRNPGQGNGSPLGADLSNELRHVAAHLGPDGDPGGYDEFH